MEKRKKRENIYLARLFLAIHPKKSGSQSRRTSVKTNDLGKNQQPLWQI